MDSGTTEMNDEVFDQKNMSKFMTLTQDVWKNNILRPMVEKWLDNFESSANGLSKEQSHALYLLSNFLYFDVREIRELLRSLYRDKFRNQLLQQCRRSLGDSKDSNEVFKMFDEELSKTRFLGVGNPSESGTHLLYFFRQENDLSKDQFLNHFKIFSRDKSCLGRRLRLRNPAIERYIFIDDICGTGTQAIEYSEEIVANIKYANRAIQVYYLTLFATRDGMNKVKDESLFDVVDCVFEFDASFKCFSDESRYFLPQLNLPVEKSFAEKMSKKYGRKLTASEAHCLGYKNSQLLIGFYHNTPDNTLPIIWCSDSNWHPIFKRYQKLY